MPSAIVKTIFFDLDKLAWTITAGGNALLQPLTIGQNDTIDFNVQFIKGGVAQTLTSPTFSAGIKVLNGFSDAFVVQFGAPTGTPPTYTFTATISSTELSAALLTGVQFAIEFRDSTNGIVTLPALTLNIVASYTISGTTPTSANGTLNVAAGKTVTFPQSLTFPSALGTNGFQLTTDGAGALTWATAGISGITIGTTTANGTAGRVLYTDGALVQQYAISGTGSVAMTNTPTLVTPVLGAATATSISVSGDITLSTGAVVAGGGVFFDPGINASGIASTSSSNLILFNGFPTSFEATMPLFTGTVAVTTHSATTTHAMFSAGAAGYTTRAIASADIATALLTPGPIGTTPNTGAFTTLSGTSTLTLGVAGPTGTAGTVVLKNATNAFTTTIVPSVVTASQQLNLPLITATDTVAVLGLTQTFTGNKTFSGTVSCGSTLAVTSTTTMTGRLTANGGITVVGGSVLLTTNSALSDNSQSNTATLTNSPGSGNPAKWIAIDDHGTERYIPTWTLDPP